MTENVLMSESLVFHSNGWFIQKRGKWLLSLWMGYWIIDSLDSFKNVDSFSIKTPLCCSETQNSSTVALIETSSANLSKKNIVLQIANFLSASLTMKNFHADYMFTCRCERKCAVKTDRLWDEGCSIWIGLRAAASSQTEKGTLVEHTSVYELAITLSLKSTKVARRMLTDGRPSAWCVPAFNVSI